MLDKKKSILYITSILWISTIMATPEPIQIIETEDELLTIIDSNTPTIIMGSMEHCPHCKHIDPVFTSLAKQHTASINKKKTASLRKKDRSSLDKNNKKIAFAKTNGPSINMHEHIKRESKERFQIPGYPIFIFIKNKQIDSMLIGGTPEHLESAITDFEKKCK